MGISLTSPKLQFFDSNGGLLNGGKLLTKVVGGGADKTTYSDAALATPNANPVVCNTRGECSVFAASGETYWLRLTDAQDVTLWTMDNVAFPVSSDGRISLPLTEGSAAAPTLAITGDLDTGFYSAAANTLNLTVGSALRWLWEATYTTAKNILRLTAGSVGAPAITFEGDENTGLYSAAANTVNVSVGGVLKQTWAALVVTFATYVQAKYFVPTVVTFTNTDATPTVADGGVFITSGTTAITDFDDGVPGQTITIIATTNITITYNIAIISLAGAVNYSMTANDTLTLTMFFDQLWTEVARSVN